MTSLEPRALPTTYPFVRQHCMPPQPDDTTASRLLQAVKRLDDVIAYTVGQLEEAERQDRATATELVDLALDPATPLTPLARLDTNIRTGLEHRLTVLRQARQVAAHRHTRAEQTDPAVVAWREQCRDIEHEWRQIMSDDNEQARFARLAEFAGRHAQNPR